MTIALTHAEVMRTATRAGELVRRLHGEPSVVIGIARSGTAPARAFAEGSGANQSLVVSLPRPSSTGSRGKARELWVKFIPKSGRALYKKLLFQTVVRLTDAAGAATRNLPQQQRDQLSKVLNVLGSGPVIIVDDSIDSGGTVRALVQTIAEINPDANIIVFALASTLGRVITDHQYTLVSGEIADFSDGDLSQLNCPGLLGGPIVSKSNGGSHTNRADLQLFLDLDGTLTTDSFRDAINSLAWLYWQRGAYLQSFGLAVKRLVKKLRLSSHDFLKNELDRRIRDLSPGWVESYFDNLSHRLRQHARPALATIAAAPSVRGVIVTAALSSYRPAIEQAFGLQVITGSGPGDDGRWLEIGSDQKIEAISQWRLENGNGSGRALLVGDTLVDALSVDFAVDSVTIPDWDRTGLATVLGVSSWWQAKAESN